MRTISFSVDGTNGYEPIITIDVPDNAVINSVAVVVKDEEGVTVEMGGTVLQPVKGE